MTTGMPASSVISNYEASKANITGEKDQQLRLHLQLEEVLQVQEVTVVNTALKFPKNAGIKFLTFIQSQEVKLDEFQLFSFPPYGTNRL